jgi:hypothetical protein
MLDKYIRNELSNCDKNICFHNKAEGKKAQLAEIM